MKTKFEMSKINAIFVGIILAGLTVFVAQLLPKETVFVALNVLLIIIALIYLGFAYFDGEGKNWIVEILGVVVFSIISVGSWQLSPKFLALGFFAHGIWDAFHHPKLLQTKVWTWYPPFCLIYDWLIAVYVWISF